MNIKINTLFLIMVALINYGFAAISIQDEYNPITSDDSDFKSIKNIDDYLYWECIYNPSIFSSSRSEQQIIAQLGDIKYSKYVKKTFSSVGFFSACGPGFCSYYIVAVTKDKSIKVINTPNDFRKFIGKIDNVEEAKLIVRNAGYIFSIAPKYMASYKQSADKYIFKLHDFGLQSCLPPVQTEPKSITIAVDEMASISRL